MRSIQGLVDPRLLRGTVGQLAVAGSLSSITFLTFTSAVPVWLVRDKGLATDDPLIGWTLAVFSLAAGRLPLGRRSGATYGSEASAGVSAKRATPPA